MSVMSVIIRVRFQIYSRQPPGGGSILLFGKLFSRTASTANIWTHFATAWPILQKRKTLLNRSPERWYKPATIGANRFRTSTALSVSRLRTLSQSWRTWTSKVRPIWQRNHWHNQTWRQLNPTCSEAALSLRNLFSDLSMILPALQKIILSEYQEYIFIYNMARIQYLEHICVQSLACANVGSKGCFISRGIIYYQ